MTFTIAHVNVARGYRGGERQTELLVRELARRGVGQIAVVRRGEPLAARLADAGVEVRPVSGHPWGTLAATRGADLVHVHEGRSVYAAYLRRLGFGTPYLITRRVTNPIKNHAFAHRAYRGAARVVAVAPQVADVLRRFDPGIDTAVVYSGSSSLPSDPATVAALKARFDGKLLIGHVGALDNKQKAQEHVIEVARRLERDRPDLHFVLVGGGDDEAMLRQAAEGLSNLTFTGFVDNVGDYLAAFDVFVLPSRKEGIGSILLDAMEHGLPIVASRVGGVPEIVRDRDNGLLIEPERPDQLEKAVLELCDSPELRRELGARGASYAKRFTAWSMADQYLAVYRQVLGLDAPAARGVP